MREIKFRGKFLGTGDWVYGDLIHKRHSDDVLLIQDDTGMGCDVAPETIGQYTGLKDANGREIYEGDILHVVEYWNEAFEVFDKQTREEFFKEVKLEDVKGKKHCECVTPVCWEEGTFVFSTREENDTFFCVLFGDMSKSQPIFIFEIVGNIYDNPECKFYWKQYDRR